MSDVLEAIPAKVSKSKAAAKPTYRTSGNTWLSWRSDTAVVAAEESP
jgi:hypothetical protein